MASPYMQIVGWGLGIIEATVIIANALPPSPLSAKILSTLMLRNPEYIRVTPFTILTCLMTILGCFIRVQCYRALGKFFTFHLSILKDHKLVTSGPYAFVRHPSYTGALLMTAGWSAANAVRGSWVRESGVLDHWEGMTASAIWVVLLVILTYGFVRRIDVEDAALKDGFGEQWEQWAARVRYRLIPQLY
jgi:protein-S-isoprenylcysteine O-methyltransferase Ste14